MSYFSGIHLHRIVFDNAFLISRSFPSHFNESLMFNGAAAAELKSDFREKFRNISRIMDCVGCEKCRLWGKLQVMFDVAIFLNSVIHFSLYRLITRFKA